MYAVGLLCCFAFQWRCSIKLFNACKNFKACFLKTLRAFKNSTELSTLINSPKFCSVYTLIARTMI